MVETTPGRIKVLLYIVVVLLVGGVAVTLYFFFSRRRGRRGQVGQVVENTSCADACAMNVVPGVLGTYPSFAAACLSAGGAVQATGRGSGACNCDCVGATPTKDFVSADGVLYQPSVEGKGSISGITTCKPVTEAEMNPNNTTFEGGVVPDDTALVIPRGATCTHQPLRRPGEWKSNLNLQNQIIGYDALDNPFSLCAFSHSLEGYREAINLWTNDGFNPGNFPLATDAGEPTRITCSSIVDANLCNTSYVAAAGIGGNFYYACRFEAGGCDVSNQCFLGDPSLACDDDEVSACPNAVITSDVAGFLVSLTVIWSETTDAQSALRVLYFPARGSCSLSGCRGNSISSGASMCRQTITRGSDDPSTTCVLACAPRPQSDETANLSYDITIGGNTTVDGVTLQSISPSLVQRTTTAGKVDIFGLAQDSQRILAEGTSPTTDGLARIDILLTATS